MFFTKAFTLFQFYVSPASPREAACGGPSCGEAVPCLCIWWCLSDCGQSKHKWRRGISGGGFQAIPHHRHARGRLRTAPSCIRANAVEPAHYALPMIALWCA